MDIYLTANTNTEDILEALCNQLSHDELQDFIIDLDLGVADYHFTTNLIARLQDSLKSEGDD